MKILPATWRLSWTLLRFVRLLILGARHHRRDLRCQRLVLDALEGSIVYVRTSERQIGGLVTNVEVRTKINAAGVHHDTFEALVRSLENCTLEVTAVVVGRNGQFQRHVILRHPCGLESGYDVSTVVRECLLSKVE